MSLPSLPPFYGMQATEEKGTMTAQYQFYNDQLWQILNQIVGFFNDGLENPNKATAEITVYASDNNVPVGTVWYNTTLNKLQVKTSLGSPGTIETIQSV